MNIGIYGCGQMGGYYLRILCEKMQIPVGNIVVHDIELNKAKQLALEYGVGVIDSPCKHDVAIIAVNTPAHASVITKLAETGTPLVLCEKPLGFTWGDIQKIQGVSRRIRIFTALVINFSPALQFIQLLMNREEVTPLELYGNWGKPRLLDKNTRPSAGDVEDEAIHPIAFALSLISSAIQKIKVSGRIGMLRFVDPTVQKHACSLDESFPLSPNHSTSARLDVVTTSGNVPIDIRSSFLLARQTRQVGGVLGQGIEPRFLFEVEFDNKGIDILTLVDLATGERSEQSFASDKLADLTRAFIGSAGAGGVDSRLASVDSASLFVKIADAIIQSDKREGKAVVVQM